MANVSAEVGAESQVNFQIHDSFQTLGNDDVDKQREIEASRDFVASKSGGRCHNALLQVLAAQ